LTNADKEHRWSPIILIVARLIVVLAVLLTLVVIDTWRLHIIPLGFEGTGVYGFLSFALAGAFTIVALMIVAVRFATKPVLIQIVLPCAMVLVIMVALVVIGPR